MNMRIQQLTESDNQYLYEGLDRSESNTMMLWESAGFKLKEAALTSDQIQQIFQNVEQGASDAGGNRTMLGKGKDAAEAVNKAWEELKTKVQNSGPISAVDQKYDSAVAKIEAGLGGPDNAISKVIMGYRKFAKEHPVAQSLIYGALIAAAGISGAGLGGAAVLGLLKMTDKLLQGEKFSSAAYSGAKTGAMAYGASKVGDLIKGKPDEIADKMSKGLPNKIPVDAASGAAQIANKSLGGAINAGKEYIAQGGTTDYSSLQKAAEAYGEKLLDAGVTADKANMLVSAFKTSASGEAAKALGGVAQSTMGSALKAVNNSIERTGKKLSEGQVYMIFNRIAAQQLTEGPMDFIKGAAAKGMDKLKTVGKNLTTKVTADKLNTAWKKAGSPMDSAEVEKIIAAAGVSSDITTKVFTDLKIPVGGTASGAASVDIEQVKKMIAALPTDRKARLLKFLEKNITATPA